MKVENTNPPLSRFLQDAGGRGSQVWQTKDLREGVFGSVATKGLSGRFRGSVANKALSEGAAEGQTSAWEAERACGRAIKRGARKGGAVAKDVLYQKINFCQGANK